MNQQWGFGSQPKQELKGKTIFFWSPFRLEAEREKGQGVGGSKGREEEGGRNVFFISQCIIYKQH